MTPEELRAANIQHFRRLLERTRDAQETLRIRQLLREETAKPDSAYPTQRAPADGA